MITHDELRAIVRGLRPAVTLLADRLSTLELEVAGLHARAAVPGPAGPAGPAGAMGEKGEKGLDGAPGRDGTDGQPGPAGPAGPMGPAGAMGEKGLDGAPGRDGTDGRDGQPGVPGVAGRDGAPGERGEKGLDGAPGRDGTLEALRVEQVDERAWRLVRADGTPIDGDVLRFAAVLDRGVYQAGQAYAKGDGVTFGGSWWIAQAPTAEKPGDGATAWRLAVKHGRDGREGKPGKDGLPGPRGERGEPGRDFR